MLRGRPFLTDSHCHLDAEEFGDDTVEALLERGRAAGVERCVTIGLDEATSRAAAELAREHEGIWAAVGVAPNDMAGFGEDTLRSIEALARTERVVAVGEIGLDYHWHPETAPAQREVFRAQLDVARDAGLPVIVHCRDAHDDTARELLDWSARRPLPEPPFGVMHCYSGTAEQAEPLVAAGFMISLSGVVTFPKASRAQRVAEEVPLEALLVETDAPYLAPQARRGRRNEPSLLPYVAEKVAELRGLDVSDVARATSANAARLFRWGDA